MGTLAVEMEAAALYTVGAVEGFQTLMVGTVSDHVYKTEEMSSEEREKTFGRAVEVAIAALQS
jgi:purine-nucleoside phosphorylase